MAQDDGEVKRRVRAHNAALHDGKGSDSLPRVEALDPSAVVIAALSVDCEGILMTGIDIRRAGETLNWKSLALSAAELVVQIAVLNINGASNSISSFFRGVGDA
jgi:hypothetical protein